MPVADRTDGADRPDGADGADGAGYPPQPWALTGSIHTSAWLVPVGEVAPLVDPFLPAGFRPLTVRGRALVGAAFAHYAPGSVLAYEELLLAVVVRRGARPAVTIPAIWVTSPASVRGGRALWSIPKHLGRFTRRATPDGALDVAAAPDPADPGPWPAAAALAALAYRRRLLLPGVHRVPLRTAQALDGRAAVTPVRCVARLGLGAAEWTFAPDGPFALLAGRRPLVSVELARMLVGFGAEA